MYNYEIEKKYRFDLFFGFVCIYNFSKCHSLAESNAVEHQEAQFDSNFTMEESDLKSFGLTDEEIKAFNNYQQSGIYLENGKTFINGVEQVDMQRGKFTWAVKAIRKAYGKIPASVKNFINKYTKIKCIFESS